MTSARGILTISLLILVLGNACKSSSPVHEEDVLPEFRAMGGKLFIYEPAGLPRVMERIDLRDIAYAGSFELFYFKKDTLWKQNRAIYQSRTAQQIVEAELQPVKILAENNNLNGAYPNSIFAPIRNPGFFRVSDAQFKKAIDDLLLEAAQEYQLFIETQTRFAENRRLSTMIHVYVFNKMKNTIAYHDGLRFDLDFRDTQTWRNALKFMLERLKENSEPPVHTYSGENRG